MSIKPPVGLLVMALSLSGTVPTASAQSAAMAGGAAMKDTLAYVGTYTNGKSKGIYLFRLQTQNEGSAENIPLVPLGLAAESNNPAFLAVDPKRRVLFAINEINTFDGQASGSVSAFAIDPATGKLALLNQRPSRGTGPCHLLLDRSGRNLLVANYGGGSIAVIRVEPDGHLGESTAFVQHAGNSVNRARQAGPHAHGTTLDAANRFAFVCDLGLDQILTYRFDADKGTLTPGNPAFTAVKPGAGPRHMVFRPDGRFAYVFNEMHSTVTVFAYDATAGRLSEVETVSSLPANYEGNKSGAEIAIVPSGKFLFVSNRGNSTLTRFEIDPTKGTLKYLEEQPTGGKTPRHFGLAPSGQHLAAANQDTGTILVSRIDPASGHLQPSGVLTEVPSPVCVVFWPPTDSSR